MTSDPSRSSSQGATFLPWAGADRGGGAADGTGTPVVPPRALSVTLPTVDPRLAGRAVRRIAFTDAEIAARVQALGAEITAAYPDGELLVIGLLKGSVLFLSDLVRAIDRPLAIDFLVVSSYGAGTVSSGNVRLLYDPETDLAGRHILLVEDIVDSGRTLARLVDLLSTRRPASLEICALLHKHVATELRHPVRFLGFDAPPEFLVGYGLDHAEQFRHLPYIASLE
jgi:hypoxanthine phosphoribosyltransferase